MGPAYGNLVTVCLEVSGSRATSVSVASGTALEAAEPARSDSWGSVGSVSRATGKVCASP